MPDSPVSAFLQRLDAALDADRVRISRDAVETALQQLGRDDGDIFAQLRVLRAEEYHLTEPSTAPEGGTIWVFLPTTELGRLWVRLCERGAIVVVSFHRV